MFECPDCKDTEHASCWQNSYLDTAIFTYHIRPRFKHVELIYIHCKPEATSDERQIIITVLNLDQGLHQPVCNLALTIYSELGIRLLGLY